MLGGRAIPNLSFKAVLPVHHHAKTSGSSLQESNGGLGLVGGGIVGELLHHALGGGHLEGGDAIILAGVVVCQFSEHSA